MNIKLTGLCRLIKSSLMMSDFPSLTHSLSLCLSLSLAVNHGTVRTVVDMLRVPGQVSHTEAIAMPALLLHGALHGGSGRLCAAPGKITHLSHFPLSLCKK